MIIIISYSTWCPVWGVQTIRRYPDRNRLQSLWHPLHLPHQSVNGAGIVIFVFYQELNWAPFAQESNQRTSPMCYVGGTIGLLFLLFLCLFVLILSFNQMQTGMFNSYLDNSHWNSFHNCSFFCLFQNQGRWKTLISRY